MSKIFVTVILAGALCLAGSKDKDWQTGKVLDPVYNPYFGETNASGNYAPAVTARYITDADDHSVADTYVIETEETVYRVERIRLKISKEAKIKKYNKIRFAVVKNKLWIEDEEGKQWSTKILAKKAKAI